MGLTVLSFSDGRKNPKFVFQTLAYKLRFLRDNPDYFDPAGIWVFTGPQGSGKTLSAVQTVLKMAKRYPNALIVSNLDIKGLDYIEFTDYSQLTDMSNGTAGIIFLLDEMHVLWNSLESKGIPFSEMAAFCQMRKERRVIIGTSQVYSRIAKPIREQLQAVAVCRNHFGLLQHNIFVDPAESIEKDGHIDAKVVGNQWWFHTPELYGSYNTLYKINRIARKAIDTGGTRR